jgi:hypothetical protein
MRVIIILFISCSFSVWIAKQAKGLTGQLFFTD